MKKLNSAKGGFVLFMVIGAIAVVSVIIGGVMGYSMFALRSASSFTKASETRLAAQNVLESVKIGINSTFKRYRKVHTSSWTTIEWFVTFTETSIGTSDFLYALPQDVNVNGMTVSTKVIDIDLPETLNTIQMARVRLQAVVTGTSDAGVPITKTIEETVEYGYVRSQVFDYAYFVNNYGWIYGNTCTVNGQARANGDFTIDSGSYVNGYIYGAPNEENGATGRVVVRGGVLPKFMSIADYWRNTGDRTRPTNPPGSNTEIKYPMGYDGTTALYPYQEPIEMPFIGDLLAYKELAGLKEGKVVIDGNTVINAVHDGIGPSGIANAPDTGCITLFGTKQKPIVIDGPVVVDRDVVISGYVTGQGTIYAGRNIHILGDITYVNPPLWEKPDNDPYTTTQENQAMDMLGLVAKGNIVLGNPENSSWYKDVSYYISPAFVNPYSCDPTDASIGYPAWFNGDYRAYDGLTRVVSSSYNSKTQKTTLNTANSRYYQSLVQDSILQGQYSYTITRVDAILYNNHAVLGKVGNCDFNGAIVTRDDALIYQAHLDINWDARLGSRSPDGLDFTSYLPYVLDDPVVTRWTEVTSL